MMRNQENDSYELGYQQGIVNTREREVEPLRNALRRIAGAGLPTLGLSYENALTLIEIARAALDERST